LKKLLVSPKVSPENNKLIKEADQLYKKYLSVVQDIKKVEETERVKLNKTLKKKQAKYLKAKTMIFIKVSIRDVRLG
jgi:hypothetical protein